MFKCYCMMFLVVVFCASAMNESKDFWDVVGKCCDNPQMLIDQMQQMRTKNQIANDFCTRYLDKKNDDSSLSPQIVEESDRAAQHIIDSLRLYADNLPWGSQEAVDGLKFAIQLSERVPQKQKKEAFVEGEDDEFAFLRNWLMRNLKDRQDYLMSIKNLKECVFE